VPEKELGASLASRWRIVPGAIVDLPDGSRICSDRSVRKKKPPRLPGRRTPRDTSSRRCLRVAGQFHYQGRNFRLSKKACRSMNRSRVHIYTLRIPGPGKIAEKKSTLVLEPWALPLSLKATLPKIGPRPYRRMRTGKDGSAGPFWRLFSALLFFSLGRWNLQTPCGQSRRSWIWIFMSNEV